MTTAAEVGRPDMDTSRRTPDATNEIAALCQRLATAHHDKDADCILDCYTPDAVIYSLAPPLGERGLDRNGLEVWLSTWSGPITVDMDEADVIAADDIGYASALCRMRGTKTNGDTVDLWFRTTLCFGRSEGRWRITHDHSSVPFLMDGSGRAALDLRP